MTTLNAIQILDIQDLVKEKLECLYKILENPNVKESKHLFISEIKRLESANKILDYMWNERMAHED